MRRVISSTALISRQTMQSLFPLSTVTFKDLTKGDLVVSDLDDFETEDFELQVAKVLKFCGIKLPGRRGYARLLMDLLNFQGAIRDDNDLRFRKMKSVVKQAAVRWANVLTGLFSDFNWLDRNTVSKEHETLLRYRKIARLELAVSSMQDELEDSVDAEDDEEQRKIVSRYRASFEEYGQVLQEICSAADSEEMYAALEAHKNREVGDAYAAWCDTARKYGVDSIETASESDDEL
jgi:hypothetical protein